MPAVLIQVTDRHQPVMKGDQDAEGKSYPCKYNRYEQIVREIAKPDQVPKSAHWDAADGEEERDGQIM